MDGRWDPGRDMLGVLHAEPGQTGGYNNEPRQPDRDAIGWPIEGDIPKHLARPQSNGKVFRENECWRFKTADWWQEHCPA